MLLIDGDVLVYECGWGVQTKKHHIKFKGQSLTFDWQDLKDFAKANGLKLSGKNAIERTTTEVLGTEEDAINAVKGRLGWIMKQAGQTSRRIFLSGSGNFREEIATLQVYKGNREDKPKPHHYSTIKEWFLEEGGAELITGMEADDALAIAQTEANGGDVICSIDKDLMMIPGKHYNWGKGLKFRVTPDEGDAWFWRQMISGDRADHIPRGS